MIKAYVSNDDFFRFFTVSISYVLTFYADAKSNIYSQYSTKKLKLQYFDTVKFFKFKNYDCGNGN